MFTRAGEATLRLKFIWPETAGNRESDNVLSTSNSNQNIVPERHVYAEIETTKRQLVTITTGF